MEDRSQHIDLPHRSNRLELKAPPLDLLHGFQSKVQPIDLLPRLYREANVAYTPSKELLEQTLDNYYLMYRDKPIKRREIVTCLQHYRSNLAFTGLGYNVSMEAYYQDVSQDYWTRSSVLRGERDEITFHNVPRTSVDSDLITEWIRRGLNDNESLPDIRFLYKLYKRRTSLMKVNKKYAIEKTVEYYTMLLHLSDTDVKGYLMLSTQCFALGKKYPVWNSQLNDLNEANVEMILTLNKWFAKKK